MIRFLITAKRNIARNKVYAFINFTGLSIGIALTLLIFIYVREEVSYDTFHSKSERIYRLKYSLPAQGMELASSPPPIAPKLPDYFNDVETTARVFGRNVSIKRDNNPEEVFEETNVFFVDTTFNDIFDLEFISGNPKTALAENQVIITEEMAEKYFGKDDPIGQTLNFANRISFSVSGVVKIFPSNSHILFNMLLPYNNMYDLENATAAQIMRNNLSANFVISHSYTYVLLKEGGNPQTIDDGMEQFMKDNANANMQLGQVFTLMPLEDIHLSSTLLAEPTATNSWSNINLFIAVSILTLLIASINYVNLATAQSFSRIKEIGIRKALGSGKGQLIRQFLSEAFLFVLISIFFSYLLIYFGLPILNDLTGKDFVYTEVVDSQLLSITVIITLLITLLAGTYPAFFVTGFNTINALKGKKIQATGGGSLLRKSLVTFQLTVASFLLVGSILIYKQLNFINNKSLGFDKDQVVMIQLFSQNLNSLFSGADSTFQMRLKTFSDKLETQSSIKATTRVSAPIGQGAVYRGVIPEGFSREDNMIMANIGGDYDFLSTFDIEVIAGRALSEEFPSDVSGAYLVNETAVKDYNWGTPEEAIGKDLNIEGQLGTVIGVVKDFHFIGLTQPLTPLSIGINLQNSPLLAVKVVGDDIQGVVKNMESSWNELFPEKSFEYTFLEDGIARQYAGFNNFGDMIKYFSLIAIVISCLGLYGMILYTTQSKMKEIGIRKVLGASVGTILKSIFKEFSVLILLAFTIAIPVSYYAAVDWLNAFQYKIEIDVFTYVIGLVVILIVVGITIGYNATKAALINPVETL
ncbi:MAG: FtsX-like permease family protein, partial [Fulvivirga sp.]|uniref:ABC transporter permease n=1 Tax=Fulvivirga sp. TaxID=1931237 RepID=UPI0032EEB4A4